MEDDWYKTVLAEAGWWILEVIAVAAGIGLWDVISILLRRAGWMP